MALLPEKSRSMLSLPRSGDGHVLKEDNIYKNVAQDRSDHQTTARRIRQRLTIMKSMVRCAEATVQALII
jgi:hypothetical protein